MSRLRLLVVAAAMSGGVVGCAHCDTCDDFPAPCTGPGCGVAAAYAGPGVGMEGVVEMPAGQVAPTPMPSPLPPAAPEAGSQPGPFSAPATPPAATAPAPPPEAGGTSSVANPPAGAPAASPPPPTLPDP